MISGWHPIFRSPKPSEAEGKPIAVVVGARRDIGAGIVKMLSRRGYFVYAECVDKTVSSRLSSLDGVCCLKGTNSSTPAGIEKLRRLVGEEKDLDVLIVNVGGEPLEDLSGTTEDLAARMETSYKLLAVGPTLACHAFGPQLRRGAKVGLFGSAAGTFGQVAPTKQMFLPGFGMSNMAAMAALGSISVHLEAWLKDKDVALSFVHPATVHEELLSGTVSHSIESRDTPFGVVLTVEECANLCLERILTTTRHSTTEPSTPVGLRHFDAEGGALSPGSGQGPRTPTVVAKKQRTPMEPIAGESEESAEQQVQRDNAGSSSGPASEEKATPSGQGYDNDQHQTTIDGDSDSEEEPEVVGAATDPAGMHSSS